MIFKLAPPGGHIFLRQSGAHVMKSAVSEAVLDAVSKLHLATYEENCWRLRVLVQAIIF